MNKVDKPKIWVSYSSEARKQLESFESEVRRQSNDQVDVISDKNVRGLHRNEIKKLIKSSDLQVLLITENFLRSNYCDDEVGQMFLPGMKKVDIRPIALIDFDLHNPTNGDYANIDNLFIELNCYLLEGTPNELSKIRITYTLKNFTKWIVNDLGVKVWENPSFTEYIDHINQGRFVPFIGPGCYGLDEDWIRVLPDLKGKLNLFAKDQFQHTYIQFVRAVVESRLPGFSKSLIDPSETHRETDFPSNEDYSTFINFSVAIAKAGAAASRIIGKSLASGEGLINTRNFSVKILIEDPDIEILRDELETARTIASGLPIEKDCLNGSSESMCLGAHGIAKKLEVLQKCLSLPDKSSEGSTGSEIFTSLTLSQLDWLGDLLWHTLRFDLPILPNNDEFAFHFSLCQASDCFVRVPLGTAGVISNKPYVGQKETFDTEIADSYERCTDLIYRYLNEDSKTNPPEGSKFYQAIAKLLWQPFTQRIQTQSSSIKKGCSEEVMDDIFPADGSRPKYPMVVSVNMDTELESCLKCVEYTVITPVQTVVKKDPYWMLRINKPRGKDDFYLLDKKDELSEAFKAALKGPLILKLRGSPLHLLPQNCLTPEYLPTHIGKRASKTTKIENRLLLSSLEYAREFSDPNSGQPSFITSLLGQSDLVMCFLGYPLDDPDALLGIQRSVWMAEPEKQDEGPEKTRISIGCNRHDGLGNAFLSGLKVEPLGIDLNQVADEIAKIPNLEEIPGIKA